MSGHTNDRSLQGHKLGHIILFTSLTTNASVIAEMCFKGKIVATNFYYVYAFKDPRNNTAKPFYIGKGTGSQAFDHLVKPDSTKKYTRIKEIKGTGIEPMVDILVEDLTEYQALKLESELISAFGTEETGGILTSTVVPSG
jgi:hypothetical protein